MPIDIKSYFEKNVIPLIALECPEVISEISIQIPGSAGLGIDDEFSDLDAVIYLDDPLWETYGGRLQLVLEHSPQQFAPCKYHADVCVWPLSWLGKRREFLEDKLDLPWEEVTLEEFFEIQENLVLRDPHCIFRRLRESTAPDRYPDWLWKKRLLLEIKKLIFDDLRELEMAVIRDQILEANIILGPVLEDLLHIGFIINRRYYPWRKHLKWAFEKLPAIASDVLSDMDKIISSSSSDWHEKVESIKAIINYYKEYIAENNLLPEIDILTTDTDYEFTWAERCEAWSDPNWRDWVVRCKQKAKEAGYNESNFWIWSLWRHV